MRSKAQITEHGEIENNNKYFATSEKKTAECKITSRVNVHGNIITDQKEILAEQKHNYKERLYMETI